MKVSKFLLKYLQINFIKLAWQVNFYQKGMIHKFFHNRILCQEIKEIFYRKEFQKIVMKFNYQMNRNSLNKNHLSNNYKINLLNLYIIKKAFKYNQSK